jgi:hypothetical protein
MKRNQALSSGVVIQQDFSDAVRAVLFQTEYEEFLYATYGGTLFVVSFQGRFYGLTCRHVFGDFEPGQMFISQHKVALKGTLPAPISGLCYPSAATGAAVGTDYSDICVIQFSEDIESDFFRDPPYIIDEKTVGTSKVGHELHAAGFLKDKTEIDSPNITVGACRLSFRDAGIFSDPFLRRGEAQFRNPGFDNIAGMSGAPVFDQTANVLCGMVARGAMNDDKCFIYYIDIFDIVRLLEGVSMNAAGASYTKSFQQ